MEKDQPNILILTLYCGENEFSQSQESIKAQTYRHWEHRVFSYLPKKKAQETVYAEIMKRREEFDLFIKLDADMVFSSDQALQTVVDFFQCTADLDHATFLVYDYPSDFQIMGVHVFSSRARWETNEDALFTDYNPVIPGKRLFVSGLPTPIVNHNPDPSPFQAFHFGVHRGLKAFQPDRKRLKVVQAVRQWSLLVRVWNHFQGNRDRRLGLSILGADLVWRGGLGVEGQEYADSHVKELFSSLEGLSADELQGRLSRWRKALFRSLRWGASVGPRVVSAAFSKRWNGLFRGSDRR